MEALAWMAWTPPVAWFFVFIGLLLLTMTIWELKSPTVPRRGMLPIVTTRGDRLFIGLLVAAFLNLALAGFTDFAQWYGAGAGLISLMLVMRWA
ncbi:MAG: DUF2160 domain-containing protein [Pseudomonadota bacterium]